jgi:hypothetical protein
MMSLTDCFGLELLEYQQGWLPAGPVFPGFLSGPPQKGKETSHHKSCD